MEEAKSMMTNMFIGYVLVLAAWLLVDYGMKALLDVGTFGVWNKIDCVEQHIAQETKPMQLVYSNPAELVTGNSSITGWGVMGANYPGAVAKNCTVTGGYSGIPQGYDCSAQIAECTGSLQGTPVVLHSATGDVVKCDGRVIGSTGGGGARPPDLSAGGVCAFSVVDPYFSSGGLTGAAQCIIQHESVCGARMVSTSDVMRDGRAFSFGPMQINLTWHDLVGCGSGGSTLYCTQAFSGKSYTATVINESLYQQCATAAQNVACNLRNGRLIYNAGYQGVIPSWGAWSTAAACGLH
jgi:hypothetical protein